MQTHQMKLRARPYICIKNGSKKIELRLNDEKRQIINLWDIIEFANQENDQDEIIKEEVLWLLRYNSFTDITNDFDASIFGDRSKDELLDLLYQFYSKEDEKKYWILWIRIK